MKLLVVGANGQVGSELCLCRSEEIQVIGLSRAELDITDYEQVAESIRVMQPDVVINASAYTAVDKAEADSAAAYAINCDGPAYLAKSCARYSIPLLHISTDYVFAGLSSTPYTEADLPDPVNVYGKSKLAGEENVRKHCPQHIILRTSWVFGRHGNNFVKTMLRLAEQRPELSIVSDQHGCPTAAQDIARAIVKICKIISASDDPNKLWGTYHYTGSPATTWYTFASKIFETAERAGIMPPRLRPIATSEYPTPARRPQYTVLDCQKLVHTFGISPSDWQQGLTEVISSLINH